jgi:hypothetical protein
MFIREHLFLDISFRRKNMKKQLIIPVVMLFLLVIISLSGCLSSEENRFIGTWRYGTEPMTIQLKFYRHLGFQKRVDMISAGMSKTTFGWYVEDGLLFIEGYTGMDLANTYRFIDEDTVIINGSLGMDATYKRIS